MNNGLGVGEGCSLRGGIIGKETPPNDHIHTFLNLFYIKCKRSVVRIMDLLI